MKLIRKIANYSKTIVTFASSKHHFGQCTLNLKMRH